MKYNKGQRNNEQRYVIRFRLKLGDSVQETYGKSVKVFHNEVLNRTQVFRWHIYSGCLLVQPDQETR